jgi:ribosomal protein S20
VEENMKNVSKKILTGTIAAAFLLGGAGVLHINQANAATETSTVGNSTIIHEKPKKDYGNHIIQDVATILGVDLTTITDQVKQGKTLAQVAQDKGVTEDVLLQKLMDAVNQSIDAAVTTGIITQTQADKTKSGLADRLKDVVENS